TDPRSYYSVSKRLGSEIPGAWYVNQYDNPSNAKAHYKTTGPEIWRDTSGDVDAVLCGMGTGGTITGIGTYLKEMKGDVRIIGVEPVGSVFQKYNREGVLGEASAFDIEGIGKNFIPSVVDFDCIDDVLQVSEDDARRTVDELVRREGLLVGESSAAVIAAALAYAAGTKGRERIAAVLPDTGLKYLSRYTGAA
ncbi:MAG: pyridoxal-phosphate dependent enzyme, partial [Candidatus Dadabacteria bacterium]|nr:pyridoxal-phosphate dependent enzyme [Candidatus Dadabacteria bacterium]